MTPVVASPDVDPSTVARRNGTALGLVVTVLSIVGAALSWLLFLRGTPLVYQGLTPLLTIAVLSIFGFGYLEITSGGHLGLRLLTLMMLLVAMIGVGWAGSHLDPWGGYGWATGFVTNLIAFPAAVIGLIRWLTPRVATA